LIAQVRAAGGTQGIDTKQLFQNLVKETLQALLELEMEEHLGYAKYDPEGRGSGNSRNGSGSKTVRGDFGEIELETRAIATAASSRRSWPNARAQSASSPKLWFRSTRVA
jgi:hypothetical protein